MVQARVDPQFFFDILDAIGPGYTSLRAVREALYEDHREDVPSSVELRWRSGEHQAALT